VITEKVTAQLVEDLDRRNRRSKVTRKGSAVDVIVWQTRTARLLPRLNRPRGNLVIRTDIGFDQPVEPVAVCLSFERQQSMEFRMLRSEHGERMKHLAQHLTRFFRDRFFRPVRDASFLRALVKNRPDDLTPQCVFRLEVIDNQLVHFTGMAGDLPQARPLESRGGENVKRRGQDAGAAVGRIARFGRVHAVDLQFSARETG